jgi:putative intracellular protease/amidase
MLSEVFNFFLKQILLSLALCVVAGHAAAANTAETSPQIRVGILLYDEVEIIDFTGPYEVFGQAGFGVVTISKDGKPVTTAMGLKVTPDHSFANAPAVDVLLVPGGDEGDASRDPAIQRFVRERSMAAKNVLSVCTGAFILASSGVLEGLEATTLRHRLPGLARNYPKVKVIRDVRWSDNGKVITAAGLSSGMDAALHLVARIRGSDAARTTAMFLEYDWKPEGGFVRTLMADRYFPEFKPNSKWPSDWKWEQLSSFGDTNQWRRRMQVTASGGPHALLEAMSGDVETMGGWQRIDDAKGYVWQREVEGRRVQFSLSIQSNPELPAAYELDMNIKLI